MAVAQMKKVDIYAHAYLRDRLIEALHDQGKLHIDNLHQMVSEESPGLSQEEVPDTRELTVRISKAAFMDQFMDKHEAAKPGFIQSLFKEKFEVTSEEYYSIEGDLDFDVIYEECETLDAELFRVRERLKRIEELREELRHWVALTVPLKEMAPTLAAEVVLGKVALRRVDDLRYALEEATPLVHFSEISRDVLNARVMVIYHHQAAEGVEEILSAFDFNPVELMEVDRPPTEELNALAEEEEKLLSEQEGLLDRAQEVSVKRPQVVLCHEYLVNQRNKRVIISDFAHTEAAFAIEGWIKASDEDEVRELVTSLSDEVEVEAFDPGSEERPPTTTVQPKRRKPFWLLTRLYGYPDYREYDATLPMAPFFVVFFGMCLGDFGYGIALVLICWLMRKKLVVSPKIQDFLILLMYTGVSAAFFGILGGSYFGIDYEWLPAVFQKTAIILPYSESGEGNPYIFLGLALGLGVLQLVVGYIVELVDNARNGRVKDAIFDQATILGMMSGIGIAAVGFILEITALVWVGVVLFIVSALLMAAMGGRESETVLGKLINGLFLLYSTLTGLVGDILSYVRLFALGLATVLVAAVVNLIAQQVLGIPFLGYILVIVILIGGHSFNLGMSFLGAFVHPLRLQYVEFFSKFYDNGAKPYDPFRVFSKKLIFKDREYLY
jgi:V/A-type H+-transporting ATPase subunit I